MDQLKRIKMKQVVAEATTDQLECYLYEHIVDILDFMDNYTAQELTEEYGDLVASMITYCYAKLVTNTANDILSKLEDTNLGQ